MFSPYYALARRRGSGDPLHHAAVNVALYGRPSRWAMTERGRGAVRRTADSLQIGPSSLHWDGSSLTIAVDEVTAPIPSRLRGTVRVRPDGVTDHVVTLDRDGQHRWWPIAPSGRIEVDFSSPSLRWSGAAYLDTNAGDAPLEDAFTTWNWSRLPLRRGAAVLYHAHWRGGGGASVAIRCDSTGIVEPFEAPPIEPLRPTRWWRMPRETRAKPGAAHIVATLEDAPFYSRSVLASSLLGETTTGIHESLSMDRFTHPLVQAMLPFRMPRRFGA